MPTIDRSLKCPGRKIGRRARAARAGPRPGRAAGACLGATVGSGGSRSSSSSAWLSIANSVTSRLPQALHLNGRPYSGVRSSSDVFSSRKGTSRRRPQGQIACRGSPLRPQAAEPGASVGSWIIWRR
jgi:hypothetical protein